jgi:hypothetical protein
LRPKIQISIGTLEDWFKQKYTQLNTKRRRLNETVPDILEEGDEEESSDSEIELNKTVTLPKLNKCMLYETWIDDFEKEKKRREKNNKKRKRQSSSSRSKSRSPTPVKSKNLQFELP